MKKFRGKKRYFRNLWDIIESFDLEIDNESWFNFSHTHLDFYAVGEHTIKIRREHIKAHIALYDVILKQLETFGKPYQSWICIHKNDPGLDAVYIHSPNPYNNCFPYKNEELNWACEIPKTFKDLIDLDKFNFSYYEFGEVYYIQSKDKGIAL
ncbi:hypothetical protein [Bacillus changyiensis]|uniref:hypothetical protein n=1 Tax=Bacillus changyiensis TaxID=3004103 RepID=UPI0022E4ADD3|nr:hypothetical protein [Bacillus changyiensis]MDA1477480.1 hypothetical protein [Bacillus changyiensis]